MISVIIPSYNYDSFVGDAIKSIQAQTYKNWECIVVDDGSADNTKSIVGEFCKNDPRITYFYQENSGLSASRNNGIKKSSGELIALLDADDTFMPDKLEQQIRILEEHKADLIFSNAKAIKLDRESNFNQYGEIKWKSPLDYIGRNPIIPSSVLMTRKLFDSVGEFSEELKSIEDGDYWFRAALEGWKFVYDPVERIVKKNHNQNMMSNKIRMYEYHIIVLRKSLELLYKSDFKYQKKDLNNALDKRLETIRWYARDVGDYKLVFNVYRLGIELVGLNYLIRNKTRKSFQYDVIQFLRQKVFQKTG